MTIAKVLSPSKLDILALNVLTHTTFFLLKFNSIWSRLSTDNVAAISSKRISTLLSPPSIVTFRFLATLPRYFSFFCSNSFRKLLLFPYPPSIRTIDGLYHLALLLSINSIAIVGFS
jgi:hypothetical protein